MKIVRWLLCVPAALVVDLMGFAGAPIFPLFADSDGYLPGWLAWWQTRDNSLDGDAGHRERWAGRSAYLRRVAWIIRNNGYGFNALVLRARSRGPVTVRGNPAVSNRPLVEGLVLRTTPEGYWQFYYVKAWPVRKRICVRLNFGWKLWGDPEHANFGSFVCTPGIAVSYSEEP